MTTAVDKARRTLTIYKASAGSGKTYTLAKEYIKLLLGTKNPETGVYTLNSAKYNGYRRSRAHRHTLAITFTNKATQEMKDRIVAELKALTVMPDTAPDGTVKDANYAQPLVKEFGCTREELAQSASQALSELLFDYTNFNVSTIDSFFQTILRTFAREVDRQGDYEVEIRDNYAISTGVAMMLDDLNYGNPAAGERMRRWLYDFMADKVQNGRKFNVLNRNSSLFSSLISYVGKASSEDFKRVIDDIFAYLADHTRLYSYRQAVRGRIAALADDLKAKARRAMELFEQEGVHPDALKSNVRRLIGYLQNGQLDEKDAATILDSAAVRNIVAYEGGDTTGVFQKVPNPAPRTKKDAKIDPGVSAAVATAFAELMRKAQRVRTEVSVLSNIPDACDRLEFLGFVNGYIERFRKENNLILLSDTTEILTGIISDDETPFVYERMGVELEHFLIDEFQDTSRMQWQVLRSLVGAGLDRHDSLIIGDEKQAIYRFRNSDSSMLHHTVADEDFPRYSLVRGGAPGENTNYRSASDVVRFNNTVFRRMSSKLKVAGYENVVQSLPEKADALSAYIYYEQVETADVDDVLPKVVEHMKRQHQAGYRWSDMAILFRGRQDAASTVDYLLKNHPEIAVKSEEALLLRNSEAVKLIAAVLKLLDRSYVTPVDANGNRLYKSRGDSMAMQARFNYYLNTGLQPDQALERAISDDDSGILAGAITELRRAHATSLTATIETIVDKFIPTEQRKREQAFIMAFEDAAIDFGKRFIPSLHDFVGWWETEGSRKASLPTAADLDAVTVMTIHKAKGLEWACVFLPKLSWSMAKPNSEMWLTPAIEDIPADITPPLLNLTTSKDYGKPGSPFADQYNAGIAEQNVDTLNLTYVAMTRAGRELIMYGNGKEVGEIFEDAISQESSAEDIAAYPGLLIDTKPAFTPDRVLEIGGPTTPDPEAVRKRLKTEASRVAELGPDYVVTDRVDTRELIAIDDISITVGDDAGIEETIAKGLTDRTMPATTADTLPLDTAGMLPPEATETPDDAELLEMAANRGIIFHAVMAEMESRNDFDRAYERVLKRTAISDSDRQRYHRRLRRAVEKPDSRIDSWYDPEARVLREQSIITPDGEILRPDRLVIHPDGTVEVVDFKFTSGVRRGHRKQLRQYCDMLRHMGYTNIRGHLWYPLLQLVISAN